MSHGPSLAVSIDLLMKFHVMHLLLHLLMELLMHIVLLHLLMKLLVHIVMHLLCIIMLHLLYVLQLHVHVHELLMHLLLVGIHNKPVAMWLLCCCHVIKIKTIAMIVVTPECILEMLMYGRENIDGR